LLLLDERTDSEESEKENVLEWEEDMVIDEPDEGRKKRHARGMQNGDALIYFLLA